jgi:hypothetical protein
VQDEFGGRTIVEADAALTLGEAVAARGLAALDR